MILKLGRTEDKYWISAHDSNDQCHVMKTVDENEWKAAVSFYINEDYDIEPVDDKGQSEELYEVNLP